MNQLVSSSNYQAKTLSLLEPFLHTISSTVQRQLPFVCPLSVSETQILVIHLVQQLEGTYVLHDMVGDEKVPTEALSTHVRYFIPLKGKDTFYILEVYISQHSLHAQVEGSRMCLFSRDHLSPTLSFDYSYEFTDQERILRRVYRVTLKDDSTLATPLHLFNFSTGHVWDYWVIYDLFNLLKDLGTEDPSTEA